MKKIIFLLALCAITLQSFAGGPSTRDIAATDKQLISEIEAIKVTLAEDSADIKRNAFIDELQVKFTEGKQVVTKPLASKEDMSNLVGIILGLLTFLVNNGLYKIKGLEAWITEKWSKTWFTISLGVLATTIAGIVASINGDASWPQIGLWLLTSWGTHFAAYASRVTKVKA
jgi:hypothetical protein